MKKFDKCYLMDELDLPYGTIKDDIVDTNRWSINHKIIFEDNGKFYETYYSEGATEYQDESPWEYEDGIECYEVELKEVKIMKWVKINEK